MKNKILSNLPLGIPAILFLLPFAVLFIFSLFESSRNPSDKDQIDLGILQEPFGWRWISTESTSFARTIRAKEFQLLVPTPRSRILFQGSQDVLPSFGIVLRSAAPVWSDPSGTQLITRLTQGESVQILAREPWRSQSAGVIQNYLIEDQLGNRGYVGSDVLMLPIQQFGNYLLGKIDMIETIPSFNPPFKTNQRIGSVVSLPVIQTPQDFMVLVPDSLNQDSLLVESQNELLSLSILQSRDSNTIEYLVFYGRNEFYPPNLSHDQYATSFHIAGVSTGQFQNGSPSQTEEFLTLQQGFILDASIPFRSTLGAVNRSTIPISSPGTLANFFELVSTYQSHLDIHQIQQPISADQDSRITRIKHRFPTNLPLKVNESNLAIRSGPSQGSPLIGRIPRDSEVRILGVHLPSTVILNNRFFWLQVEVLGQEEEIFGWMWGEFLVSSQ